MLLRAVSRLVEPHGGSNRFDGSALRKVGAARAVVLSIGHSPATSLRAGGFWPAPGG